MAVVVEKVVTRRDFRRFVEVPAVAVYRNDPYWVRPLDMDMEAKFHPRKNPFLEHAEIQPFLASKGGRPVGRICAILNRRHNEFHDERAAFFGWFECVEDPEVASALFAACEEWAKAKGMAFLRGPANFSSNDDWGLLVDGFDSSPMVMMPYNPRYYIGLLEGCGFRKEKDLVAYRLDLQKEIPERIRRAMGLLKERTKVEIRTLRMDRFEEEVRTIQEVYNRAWERNWGFVPMTEAEIVHLAKELKPVVDPELVLIAEMRGKPVGFAMALPDYNQLLKRLNGKLFPFGILYLLLNRRKIASGRLLTLGLVKEVRNTGIEALFYLQMWETGRRKGYLEAELSWILEDNLPMRNGIEKVGGEVYKTYRIYRKDL